MFQFLKAILRMMWEFSVMYNSKYDREEIKRKETKNKKRIIVFLPFLTFYLSIYLSIFFYPLR